MKYFIYVINSLLVLAIPIVFIMTPTNSSVTTKKIEVGLKDKYLKSEALALVVDKENTEVEDNQNKEESTIVEKVANKKEVKEKVTATEEVIEEVPVKPVSDVLETQVGTMSGYGPDCVGCSGFLSSGKDARNGNIYYQDPTYGTVRIVAGDRTYKFGTIVRIKNSRAGSNLLAVVLDRGGAIGFGRRFLFDLLYASESDASKDEVSSSVTFEILRYGY